MTHQVKFQPIAVVGRGCILPGCCSVDELWRAIAAGDIEISSGESDDWRVDQQRLLGEHPGEFEPDRMWSTQGGYVRHFSDHFDATRFSLDPALLDSLDPVFLWSLEAARQALAELSSPPDADRAGVVLGNLSYPTRKHSQFAEQVLLQHIRGTGAVTTAAENRFMSGLPAQLVAQGLGLEGQALALDAACASGLYAIKIACDRLQQGSADLMLAGGVNAADPLFIHMGFSALKALSPSGSSRPFHQQADGLVPSEGAAFVALKRLADARADGDHIYGVIRGVGLSNDGRSGGFLSPSSAGQIACMEQAYAMAGLSPAEVQFVECHATGTEAGDATEIASMAQVFGANEQLALGSLKANLGHLITASGVAGLLKVMLAFEHKTLPATPNAQPALRAIAACGFHVPDSNREWLSDGPRLAAVSSFGFGGNNAHLLVQEHSAELAAGDAPASRPSSPFAVVGLALRSDRDANATHFAQRLCGAPSEAAGADNSTISLAAQSLAFPPRDLQQALGQQLILLDLLPGIQSGIERVDSERTGIFIGMQTDSEVCRYGLRWRLPELDPEGRVADADITPALNAAGVIGKMPNIPANRLSNQLNITGPGFTVSREELSGDAALTLAMSAIERGELDAAIVGAVDLCNEQVHQAALAMLSPTAAATADGAVLLVLKSLQRARADGDEVLALVEATAAHDRDAQLSNLPTDTSPIGDAGAAAGLLTLAAGIQCLRAGAMPGSQPAPGNTPQAVAVHNQSRFGGRYHWRLSRSAAGARPYAASDKPQLEIYGADNRRDLIANIEAGTPFARGSCRVALVGRSDEFAALRRRAIQGISAPADTASALKNWSLNGVSFSDGAVAGEIAAVFTGAAAAYPGMGRELFPGLPGIAGDLAAQMPRAEAAMAAAFDADDARHRLPFYQLAGCSYLCQFHARIVDRLLALKPDVALGLSSGETNSMFAFGAWQNMDSLLADIDGTELYRSALAQDFSAVHRAWKLAPNETVEWHNYRVLAPVEAVRAALADEDFAYLTIIQSRRDCVIGGQPAACDRVLAKLGNPEVLPLGHDLAVHCAVVAPFESTWRALHTRATTAPPGIRFYSNYLDGVYTPTEASVADALTGQALQTIDFPKIVEAAWHDGVRIFIEHGPRNSLASAIDDILGDRPHLAVSLDHAAVPSMTQLYRTAATLWCAGVDIDLSQLAHADAQTTSSPAPSLPFSLRLPAVRAAQRENNPPAKPMHDSSPTTTYLPPACPVGTPDGRLIPAAPALAYTRARPAAALQLVTSERAPAPVRATKPVNIKADSVAVAPPPLAAAPAPAPTPQPAAPGNYQLLIDAHRQMLDGHQRFLAAQIEGQRAFADTMMRIQQTLFADAPKTTAPVPVQQKTNRPGPSFSRQQLEVLAGGKISSVLGKLFEQQDGYEVQVRMPEPPLLLCDRVMGIKGAAGSMGTGTIWTETDVTADQWYLHHGRMPPGVFIECGQADLLLISWLGVDFHNKGERAYRLLGCDLVFHGDLPQVGDTLEYEIKVDGHAQQGDVRLFFFHYDCRIDGALRISVRNGQAGFFTNEELADSAGVLWEAADADYTPDVALPEASAVTTRSSFDRAAIAAYLQGELQQCFGAAFALTHTHTRTPRSPSGQGNFLGEVTEFAPRGGPAGRGYLRIVEDIHADHWFFDGHFKNDPCMPGTLMADACLQAMAFYMSARGYTLERDGWRFQPVRGTDYRFVCRGQAVPESRQLVYEVFIDEEIAAKQPKLFAHVLCSVDGRKAFLCERLGLELVPDWPLSSMPELSVPTADTRPLAHIGEFPLDYGALISCAWGQPSRAFGPGFAHYDGPLRSPRLPGPPYHFMTRIAALEGEMASMKAGGQVEALYDIPADAWYFLENGARTMPYCILLEIALQPCGWLASYTLGRDYADSDLLFRNLDGKAVQHREIVPGDTTLKTRVKLSSISRVGELIIENFDVVCSIDDQVVYTVQTVFGFFPPDAMKAQKGLAINERERLIFDRAANTAIDLETRPAPYFDHPSLHLPDSKLLMVDRITWLDAGDGAAGAGSIRGEKDVDIEEWFFKAHFFQDPVQPGSLGIEAMLQLMQAFMIEQNMHHGFAQPRFEPVLIDDQAEWHYRGQVTPEKRLITIDFECAERGADADSCWIKGEARLWADGLKIYHAPKIGMRIVEDSAALANPPGGSKQALGTDRWQLDINTAPWIADHCPTYTVPSLPMMAELELMAQALQACHPGATLSGIDQAEARSWLAFNDSAIAGRVQTSPAQDGVVAVQLFRDAGQDETLVATAQFTLADRYPTAPIPSIAPLLEGREVHDIYASGTLFHGPALQLLTRLELGSNGASGVLDLAQNGVPTGILNPGLLDAALHCIPHDGMEQWSEQAPRDHAAYPLRVEQLVRYRAAPEHGLIQVEARFIDLVAGRFPRTQVFLLQDGNLIAEFSLREVLLPKGPLGTLPPAQRRAFLTGQRFVADAGITHFDGASTSASAADVAASNWLPGTLEQVVGFQGGAGAELLERIVQAEHGARSLLLHPARIQLDDRGLCRNAPLNHFVIATKPGPDSWSASGSPAALDWRQIRDYWLEKSGGRHYLINDLGVALIRQFVRHIVLEDPQDFQRLTTQPAIYLANHQIYAESFLFLSAIAILTGIPAEAIAKTQHQQGWIGDVYRLAEAEMGDANPMQILFLDREDPTDLLRILKDYSDTVAARPRSLLVHVEGTRARQGGQATEKVSSVLVDLAIDCGLPIVPVRFCGGLPVEDRGEKYDFPVDLGRQDHFIGRTIPADQLRSLPYKERTTAILDGINNLGPDGAMDQPLPADAAFSARVEAQSSALSELQKVLLSALRDLPEPGAPTQALLRKIGSAGVASEDYSAAEAIALKLLWTSH